MWITQNLQKVNGTLGKGLALSGLTYKQHDQKSVFESEHRKYKKIWTMNMNNIANTTI